MKGSMFSMANKASVASRLRKRLGDFANSLQERRLMNADAKQEFEPGSVVALKSGGPRMTVLDIGKESGVVWCMWFQGHETYADTFVAAQLTTKIPKLPHEM